MKKRSPQKIHELRKSVSKEPIRRKLNHNRMENIERAAQRRALWTGSDFIKTCLIMKSEIADDKKRSKPNCKARIVNAPASKEVVITLPIMHDRNVSNVISLKDGKINSEE